MTLCAAWRLDGVIHMASDTRISFGAKAADIGIKVLRAPYRIRDPDQGNTRGAVLAQGDLGICFAGSTSGAMFTKEAIVEVLPHMQAVAGYIDTSMEKIAELVFHAYRAVSRKLASSIFRQGHSTVVVAGYCAVQQRLRAFLLDTDAQNAFSWAEVLLADGDHLFIGSGKPAATARLVALAGCPGCRDYLDVVRAVIDDASVPDVGGPLQYGRFVGEREFRTYGMWALDDHDVHYWRGPLDLRSDDFDGPGRLVLGYPFIDPG